MKNKFLLEEAKKLLVQSPFSPTLAQVMLIHFLAFNRLEERVFLDPFFIATEKLGKYRTDCVLMCNKRQVAVGASGDKIIVSKSKYTRVGKTDKDVLVDRDMNVQKGDFPDYEKAISPKSKRIPLKLIEHDSLKFEFNYRMALADSELSNEWYMPICHKTDDNPEVLISIHNIPYILKCGVEGWDMIANENGTPGPIVKNFEDGGLLLIAPIVKNK